MFYLYFNGRFKLDPDDAAKSVQGNNFLFNELSQGALRDDADVFLKRLAEHDRGFPSPANREMMAEK